MKKILLLALLALGALLTAACGSDAAQTSGDAAKAAPVSEPSSAGDPAASQQPAGKGKVLVAYFSRAGENYRVGYIKKGNTHIMADMIADVTGADTFEITRYSSAIPSGGAICPWRSIPSWRATTGQVRQSSPSARQQAM